MFFWTQFGPVQNGPGGSSSEVVENFIEIKNEKKRGALRLAFFQVFDFNEIFVLGDAIDDYLWPPAVCLTQHSACGLQSVKAVLRLPVI